MELHKQEDYDLEFINSLIKNEIEENINIDFKSGQSLDKADKKKAEISKDVSAFANSNGGIIIYGINEVNHKADSISFIDGNIFTKEWLEQVINSSIHRTIQDLRIFPIRFEGKIEKSVYIVQIPESLEAPHMAKDKRYYRRYNFESVAMEEFEIRNSYFKKSKSDLKIASIHVIDDAHIDEISHFTIDVDLKNLGTLYTDEYKINLFFEPILAKSFIVYNGIHKQKVDITKFENKSKVSAEPKKTIYPGETQNALRVEFSVNANELKDFLFNTKMKVQLSFPFGEDSFEDILMEFLMKNK